MSTKIIHRAELRGTTNQGWLHSRHTFSFGDYYHPDCLHFGALRVINDDMLAPGRGFGSHPHSNMEIVTIPLDGELDHKDNNNEESTLVPGEVQVISAGKGMFHNLQNKNKNRTARYLQLWYVPKIQGVNVRVDTHKFNLTDNELIPLITPDLHDETLWIFQDVWLYQALLSEKEQLSYTIHQPDRNGIYIYLIEGCISIDESILNAGDGAGFYDFSDQKEIVLKAVEKSRFLLTEVPMKV